MRRFLNNAACFGGSLVLAGMLLFVLPLDRKFAWQFIRGDCYGHGAWLYQRLAENPAAVDAAFIGSSRMLHAVWEKAVEDTLATLQNRPMYVLNLGYCRLGNNLCYAVAREVFQHKKPAALISEVREEEERFSHPMFGYVAGPADVLLPDAGPHRRMIADLWNAAVVRLEYQRARLFGFPLRSMDADSSRYGYGADNTTADAQQLLEIRANNARQTRKPASLIPHFPRVYLEKTMELARSNNARVAFLYLPAYGSAAKHPAYQDWYEQYGPVWLPPQEILDDPANWLDHAHLNDRGAGMLAGWLARKMADW